VDHNSDSHGSSSHHFSINSAVFHRIKENPPELMSKSKEQYPPEITKARILPFSYDYGKGTQFVNNLK